MRRGEGAHQAGGAHHDGAGDGGDLAVKVVANMVKTP